MKKMIARIACFAFLIVLTFSLVSCSTYKSILSEFESAGYTEITDEENEMLQKVTAELKEGNISCTFHVLRPATKDGDSFAEVAAKVAKTILILEFESDKELEKALEENGSETLKGLIKDLQNSEYVNGNCILLPIANLEAKEIFNRA